MDQDHQQIRNQEEEEVYVDDVMLPGFRFHPTDEELVDFYLKRKTLNQPLSIELIRQLDIYKYDPWDLPKLAITGEKEWYFYCQRDRKYRNSARPNRVTEAGFWKATGTDRPIYSSNNNKPIIGLKKSLVFYKGRASKALKTDWMMHEFRLPNHSPNILIPPNDSWAICRIFKKTNISAAQRAVSSSLQNDEIISEDQRDKNGLVLSSKTTQNVPFSTNNTPCNFPISYDPFDYLEGKLPQLAIPNDTFAPHSFTFEPMEVSDIAKSAMDVSSILLNMSSSLLGDFDSSRAAETSDPFTSFQPPRQPDIFSLPTTLLPQMQGYDEANALLLDYSKPLESVSSIGYPLSCIWDKLLN